VSTKHVCLLCAGDDSGELSFDVQPEDTLAFVGRSAMLHCLVSSQLRAVEVIWIKDGSHIQFDARRFLVFLLCQSLIAILACICCWSLYDS